MFYENLNEICRSRGTNPTALCKALGLSTSYPTGWKNGRRPRLDTVQQIAAYLEVPIAALLDGAPQAEPSPDSVETESNREGHSMFKRNFEKICFEKRIAPSVVCKDIGLSSSTYSLWTDTSVPRRATLRKLCEYLNVTEEELLSDGKVSDNDLTAREQGIIAEYRRNPSFASIVDAAYSAVRPT